MRSNCQPGAFLISCRDLIRIVIAVCLWLTCLLSPMPSFARGAQDAQVNTANQLLAEAEKLRAAGTPDARRAAIEKYKESLTLWQSLGDRGKEAAARHGLCSTHNALGERQIALGHCEQALATRREMNDQRGEAETLNLIGNIQLALHGPQQALDYFQRALAIRRALGDQRGIAVSLGNLARLYIALGDIRKELEALREALPLAKAAGDKALELTLLNHLGNTQNRFGELENAADSFQQVISLSRALNDKLNEAGALSNLGKLLYETGEKQRAMECLMEALPLHRTAGNRSAEAATLITLGGVWRSLGDFDKALSFSAEAVKLAKESGNRLMEVYALLAAGDANLSLGDYRKALDFHQQGLSLSRTLGNKREEAIAISRSAADWNRLNDLPQALEHYRQAITLHRETGNRLELMFALLELSAVQINLGNFLAAADACRDALDLSLIQKDRESQAHALAMLGQIASRQGDFEQARDQSERAMKLIESTAAGVGSHEIRGSYLAFNHKLYRDYVELLMSQHRNNSSAGYDRQALQTAERARARALIAMLVESHADIRQGAISSLLEREKGLLKKLAVKAAEQNQPRQDNSRFATVSREIDELTIELELVRAQMATTSPRYAALTQPQPLSLSEIQQTVVADPDTLLLEYALGEERGYLWAVTNNSVTSHELPKRKAIERSAERLYALMTARNQRPKFESAAERQARVNKADAEFQLAAAELSRIVLGPVANQLGKKRLLVVADGKLQYVPFAALPVPAPERAKNPQSYKPLIAEHEVVHLPSASALAVLRRELKDRQPAPKTVAALADPVFDASDERVKSSLANAQAAKDVARTRGELDELTRAIGDLGAEDVRGALARLPYTRQEAEAIVGKNHPRRSAL
jgi:tetratricopeptide (TPR) repeat protein